MNRVTAQALKPFISVMLIIMTLFGIVFLQMEERRNGYALLKLRREHKILLEEKRTREIQLAKITRPQLLESMAHSRFTLKKVQASQIIHLSGEGLKVVR
ncbi:MAG: histidine kinase [Bdellovibrionaceae bacterium]|nr:histidine kinase [Pseudobdellovibrionaceae bacterium]MBX3032564.1 histidine kinase [Pseudobdellovibrionaceae bacterium]